ncbi:hypothetical protein AJ80_08434 [Polytolypa hystricis UAMH7299]|uniref:Uncharacterized protein n=1 Tax=Polytolypa hystricis (strain UAMH7299) TaxID=1447883 RepID=A0A2B7X7E2_POLH7|nr:hypothetical protein AJ80_08434 [Polytolypa hystricis UAMH7299]
MKLSPLAICGLAVLASAAESATESQSMQEKVDKLRKDPEGILHLGGDGVLRSWSGDYHTVIDYIRLRPKEIKHFYSGFARNHPEEFEKDTEESLAGIDGRTVTDAQVFNPPEALLEDYMIETRKKGFSTEQTPSAQIKRDLAKEQKGACDGRVCTMLRDCGPKRCNCFALKRGKPRTCEKPR